MLLEDHGAIFVHIPKTAGQSVEFVVTRSLGIKWEERRKASGLLLGLNTSDPKQPSSLAHLTAQQYLDFGYVSGDTMKRSFVFTFVRNPFSRLVSSYHYLGYDQKMSFRRFVLNSLPEPGTSRRGLHTVPQVSFVRSHEGEMLVDFVGRFETFERDLFHIVSMLGIDVRSAPHINQSPAPRGGVAGFVDLLKRTNKKKPTRVFEALRQYQNRHDNFQDYYTPRIRERVEELFAEDLEQFDYSFDPTDSAA